MRVVRTLAAVAVAAAMLLLVSCAGLPTTGPVSVGRPVGEEPGGPEFAQIAEDPVKGATPQKIVEGFLEAAITPANDWSIARKFLTSEMNERWVPSESVTIDDSSVTRSITAVGDVDDEKDVKTDVDVKLNAVAAVDSAGIYTGDRGASALTFHVVREKGGEWRISEAPNGVVLDAETFPRVFRSYSLQYFDPSWTRLVPDLRWLPRRPSNATALTQALVTGEPATWLAPGVRSAFTDDVGLSPRSVSIDPSQVAEVDLTRSALSLDATTLARMRTQLEATLAPLGVVEVRFTVDQRPLDAGEAQIDEPATDAGTLVLTEDGFGTAVGDQIVPVGDLTAQIGKISDPIVAIDVAEDESFAAVQIAGGHVYRVSAGKSDEIDERSGLIAPSIDNKGYIWTAPRNDPRGLQVSGADAVPLPVGRAFPAASAITALRVSMDGARVAALVTVGGQSRAVIAAIIRDDRGMPIRLGEMQEIGRLTAAPQGLAWLGSDAVVILMNSEDPRMMTQPVGGPRTVSAAPGESTSIAGARTSSGVRILNTGGVLFAQRGSAWQESLTGVKVLGTRSGQ